MKKSIGERYTPQLAYAYTFFGALWFTIPIRLYFSVDYLGISLGQATLLNTIGVITSILFEVPSGARADRYGRKKIMIIGGLLILPGLSVYLWSNNFLILVLGELWIGFAEALISGSLVALVYDRYKHHDNESGFQQFSRNRTIIMYFSRAFAAGAGVYVYKMYQLLPYILLMFNQLICVLILFGVQDTYRYNTSSVQQQSWKEIISKGFGYLTSHTGLLYTILGVLLVFGVGDIFRSLYQKLGENRGYSLEIIGISYVIASLLSALGSYSTKRWYKKSLPQFYRISSVTVMISFILLYLLPGSIKIFAFIPLQIAYGFYLPIIDVIVNERIPSSHRSTVNSRTNGLQSFGRLVFGGLAGFLYTQLGFEYLVLGVILVVVITSGMYYRYMADKTNPPTQQEAPSYT